MKLPSIFEMMCYALWAFMAALIIACLCTSCAPKCLPELVEVHDTVRTHDSVYIHHTRDSIVYRAIVDSTYIDRHDSTYDRMRGDTVYLYREHTKTEYRYRLLHDSIYIHLHDTLYQHADTLATHTAHEVDVKTDRYIPGFYRWSTWVCWLIIVCFVLYIVFRIAKFIYFRK